MLKNWLPMLQFVHAMISIVIMENKVIKLVSGVRKADRMIKIIIRVNEMVSSVTKAMQGLVWLTG